MVGVGGGEVVLRITGVQKTNKRRRRKSCLWTGLIHRGEEGTKSGYKKTKRGIKILACGLGLNLSNYFFWVLYHRCVGIKNKVPSIFYVLLL